MPQNPLMPDEQLPQDAVPADEATAAQVSPEDAVPTDAAPQDAATPAGEGGSEGEQATPEEEQAMEEALMAAGKDIYQNPQAWDSFIEMTKKLNLPEAVGQSVAAIVQKVDQEQDLPETVIVQFAGAVCMMIVDAGIESGDIQADDTMIQKCLSESIQSVMENYDTDPADIDAAVASMNPDDIREGIQKFGELNNGQ